MQTEEDLLVKRLTAAATEAAGRAYAPYSNFRVGAALLLDNGALVTGANVENASYGLTICAERSAMVRAVAEHGPAIRVVAAAITNLNDSASPPCGACRQVLSEFMSPAAWLVFRGRDGWERQAFSTLFPFHFTLRAQNS
jgi:cytidine deaminase